MSKFDFVSFGIKLIKAKRLGSISFHEVLVIPSQSEKFYQLINGGKPTGCVYSESYLLSALKL